jgi:hypothetical protein
MTDQLSSSEQRTLNQLNDDIRVLTEEYKSLLKKKSELQYEKELSLKSVLIKEHEQLTEVRTCCIM